MERGASSQGFRRDSGGSAERVQQRIRDVVERRNLTAADALETAETLLAGAATPAQVAGLLIALRMKGETVDELSGFVQALRCGAVRVPIRSTDVVDPVGTGGDALSTFNISTTAAFVAAGAGCRVAKHGNRAISSACGSADVLRALGVNVEASPEVTAACIDEVGIGFLFAQLYHPGLRHVIGPRRELGVRTLFNLLGPLANPAGARRQVIGIYDRRLTHTLAEVLGRLGSTHALVVHGEDGLDEISLSGPTTVSELRDGGVRTFTVAPEDFGVQRAPLAAVCGGDAARNAEITRAVLTGERGPRRDIVLLNAAATIYAAGRAETLAAALRVAAEAIDSGAAVAMLEALIARSNGKAS